MKRKKKLGLIILIFALGVAAALVAPEILELIELISDPK